MTADQKADVIIVGGGLFGSILAVALMDQGRDVIVIDDQREAAGSLAAGCVMRPSWLTSLAEQHGPAMALLARLFGSFRELPFDVVLGPATQTVLCHWVDPGEVMTGRWHSAPSRALAIDGHTVTYDEGGCTLRATAPLIIVAAGIWTAELLPELRGLVTAKWGVSFRHREKRLARNFIRPWAPFKQVVGLNWNSPTPSGVWVGDGRALNHWTDADTEASRARCALQVNLWPGATLDATVGARPYAKTGGAPALLQEVRPGVWAATGGAKNGTAAAAWCALRLMEVR